MSIRIRHAEDLADNRHGQRSGQVPHQVKGPIMRQRLDELRGNSLRGVTPALHDAMGEGRLHQSSHPSVCCTVLADDGIERGSMRSLGGLGPMRSDSRMLRATGMSAEASGERRTVEHTS